MNPSPSIQLCFFVSRRAPISNECQVIQQFTSDGQLPLTSVPLQYEQVFMVLVNGEEQAVRFLVPPLDKLFSSHGELTPFHESSILKTDSRRLSFIYGVSPSAPETALSRDLVAILQSMGSLAPMSNLTQILKIVSLSIISIKCNLNPPSNIHVSTLRRALCPPNSLFRPYKVSEIVHGAHFTHGAPQGVLNPPKGDLLGAFVGGFLNAPGSASGFMFTPQHGPQAIVNQNFCKTAYIVPVDYWIPEISTYTLSGGRMTDTGLAYTYGQLQVAPRDNLLKFLYNSPNQWFGNVFYSSQLGIASTVSITTSPRSSYELPPYTRDIMDAYMIKMRCCGLPCTQGYFFPIVKSHLPLDSVPEGPIAFTGAVCFSRNITTDLPPETRHKINIYQLGTFTSSHEDSGREVRCLLGALKYLMSFLRPSQVKGISAVKVCETMHAKLLSVCQGTYGIKIYQSALPPPLNTGLLPFTASNRQHNMTMIKQHFLNIVAPIVLVAIEATPDNTTDTVLKAGCAIHGCQYKVLGRRTQKPHIHIVKDKGEQNVREQISLKRYSPSYPISITNKLQKQSENWQDSSMEWDTLPSLSYTLLEILKHPAVGCKDFIVKHIDRLSSGRVAQQQGIGARDIPISDYSILVSDLSLAAAPDRGSENPWATAESLDDLPLVNNEPVPPGICSAIGECFPLSTYFPIKGAHVAIVESLLNIVSAPFKRIDDVTCTFNITWPQTTDSHFGILELMRAGREFCSQLGIGCVFTSCTTSNRRGQKCINNSLVRYLTVTATAPCKDVTQGLTPDLKEPDSSIVWLPISTEYHTFGTVISQLFRDSPSGHIINIDPLYVKKLITVTKHLINHESIISCHDVGCGGLITACFEMAYAGGASIAITVPQDEDPVLFLTSETPGLMVEVPRVKVSTVQKHLERSDIIYFDVGRTLPSVASNTFTVSYKERIIFRESLNEMVENWRHFSTKEQMRTYPCEYQGTPEDPPKDLQLHLTFQPSMCPHGPYKYHQVNVYLLPGTNTPDSLLVALEEAGFRVNLVSTFTDKTVKIVTDTTNVFGICLIGATNIEDATLGDKAISMYTKHNPVLVGELKKLINSPDVFSLAIGHTACQILFENKFMGYNKPSNTTMYCKENYSGLMESRWLNFFIPENTRAVALQSMKGSLLPGWIQGTHLGFAHPSETYMEMLSTHGMVATQFYGADISAGPALTYPQNPTAGYTISGLCSADGRHLALLHDPGLSNNLWQWPHIPKMTPPLKVSPWKRMFLDLHIWANKVREMDQPPPPRPDPLRNIKVM
nr:v-FGAM-synthase [Bovine gammaherpesvirus 4]